MKKIFFGIAIVLVLLLGALMALPYFFKDEIITQVKQTANESLTAKLDFKDVSLSVFSHFPQLSIGLQGLEITGTGQFDGVKLVQCEQLDLAIDLWSAIFGDKIAIKGLFLKNPNIRVYVLEDGSANYDITKPEPEPASPAATTESSPIQLEQYAITNGNIFYDDRSLDMRAELEGLDHKGSGEFTADIYDLVMKTGIQKLSVNYGGMQYLRNARADWDATLNADMANMKFTFKNNDLKVNALQVMLDGWFQMPNDVDYVMDLKFGTPQNTFKSLLSIIPGAYTPDFEGVKADGTVQFAGQIKGKYNETTYPAFKINLKVANGNVKYPSLPLGISNINVDATVNSPSSTLNAMTVNIPSFGLKIGSNPIGGYFNLKTPETNPSVDTKITGTLNMGELSKAFPMEGVQDLSGIIKANIMAKASMNQIDAQQYEQVQMAGDFSIQNLNYRAAGTPTVRINSLETSLSPQKVDIRNFDARLGKSDIRASGKIDNVLAYFSTNKTMTGSLTMRSGYFDANEWMTEPAATEAPAGKVPTASPSATEKVFDQWDFTIDGEIGKLVYEDYNLSNMRLKGNFTPNKMTIDDFAMKINDSDLHGNGRVLNAWDYMFDNRTVSGTLNLKSDYFDLNPFMTEEPAATSTTTSAAAAAPESVMLVPENIDMTLNANFAKVRYTNLDLQNLDGQVVVKNGAAKLKDFTADILGGQVAVNGEYNTQDPAKPAFDVDLALGNMGFRDAFQNFATIKAIAPLMQLVDGKFNTTFSMSGLLGKDMTPDFNTISAAGFLETISAVINNFKPLNEIGSKLNVSYLSKMELKNTKNWFEIKDGKLTVKPFNFQVRDVAMQAGGSHSLTSDMNYQLTTKMPRKALEKNAVGSAANSGLKWLSGEASKYGVNVAQGEFINVRFDITGTMTSPKVGIKVLPSDGQSTLQEEATATGKDALQQAQDSLRNVASRELDKAKEKAAAAADKAIDSATNVATKKVNEVKDKAVEEAGKVINQEVSKKVVDEAAKKAEEILKNDKNTEDVKKKLEEWNPLKKKKN
ncbi:MAG: AsmA family protein [Saprospiraceae bacterium]|nr:AsmA family protein [Saprospiraceae bacterium]